MNRVPRERRTQIINCLIKGNSIRSTERMTATHRDTITRLMVQVGEGCNALMDELMQGLPCRRIQMDEIWTYVQKKQRWITDKDDTNRVGDMWTFVALDADTKLVPNYRVGKRDFLTASAFLNDLSSRLVNRIECTRNELESKWRETMVSGCKGASVHGRNLGTCVRCSNVLPRQEDPYGRARCRDEYSGRRASAPGAAEGCQ
jgi:hypothetical protein